ncbi:MAG: hypothetical protein EOO62_06470 [Hymenobacter sp.]|nr:MAG: hypothetical protein EOO62_06470 [Hymenobacter sp.]
MKLFAKIAALFSTPPAPVVTPPLYPDAEFLEAVMQHARQKNQAQDAQAARTSSPAQKTEN